MEDERTSSPTDLVFFNKMFSFMFSFVRKCSRTKFFTPNPAALTKPSLGKAPLGSSVQDNTYGKHSQGRLRLEQEHELDL